MSPNQRGPKSQLGSEFSPCPGGRTAKDLPLTFLGFPSAPELAVVEEQNHTETKSSWPQSCVGYFCCFCFNFPSLSFGFPKK